MSNGIKQPVTTEQLALPIALSDKACFENFWVGRNSELVTALQHTVQLSEPNLVYYYGVTGAGKSHLLFAVMRLAQQEVIKTSYLALNDLVLNDSAIIASMFDSVDTSNIVCVDDIQACAGNVSAEKALFTLFEQIKHAGGQLIVSASQPADDLSIQLPDLVSRLSSGLVYPLHSLNEPQQFEAVKMRANYRGMAISDETVKYLLMRLPRDSALLFSILDKIDHAALVEKRKITIPFLQTLFKKQKV